MPASVSIGNGPDTEDGSYLNAHNQANTLAFTSVMVVADNNIDIVDDIDLETSVFGRTVFDFLLVSPTINIANDMVIGDGQVYLNAPIVNLGGTISSSGSLLDASRLHGEATLVNVLSDQASIQQAIDATGVAPARVDVAAGIYDGTIVTNRGTLTLVNHGTINGSVELGDDGDIVVNEVDGSISGALKLGGGNDALLHNGGAIGSIDGGDGSDTVIYAYIAALKGVRIDLSLTTVQNTVGAGFVTLLNMENVVGSSFADVLKGNGAANQFDGGSGADKLFGFGGTDVLLGGHGADQLWGGEGNDSLDGDTAADKLYGEAGEDILAGGDGADVLDGGDDADTMTGGIGSDKYFIDDAGDQLFEDSVINIVTGKQIGGSDWVFSTIDHALGANVEKLTLVDGFGDLDGTGNELKNVIVGNDGDNILNGGANADVLTGGAGADRFVFDVLGTSATKDVVKDFVSGTDTIELSVSSFGGLAGYGLGTLDPGELTYGSKATTADQNLIYNPATGALLYDVDGVGGAAAVAIALLSGQPTLNAGDIVLIG